MHSSQFGLNLGHISWWISIYFGWLWAPKLSPNWILTLPPLLYTDFRHIGVSTWQCCRVTTPSRISSTQLSLCLQLLIDSRLWKPCIRPCFLILSLRLSKIWSHPTPLLVPLMMTESESKASQVEDHLHSIATLYTNHYYNTHKPTITKTNVNLRLLFEDYKINRPEIFRSSRCRSLQWLWVGHWWCGGSPALPNCKIV